jgi:hypothetical protein
MKRPIYWMFSSPNGSFQALVYLQRYTRDTVDRLLNDYVRTFIDKLGEEQRQLNGVRLNDAARAADKTKAAKDLIKIEKMLKEIRDWNETSSYPWPKGALNWTSTTALRPIISNFQVPLCQFQASKRKRNSSCCEKTTLNACRRP